MVTETKNAPLIENRSCDGCTMCCKVLAIPELEKPLQTWCSNCNIGSGCTIYDERPEPCRVFYCQYRRDPGLGEEWAPSKSKMVVDSEVENERLAIYVDESRKRAWREKPYYAQIMSWATALYRRGMHLLVWEGRDAIIVLPDREIPLGKVGPNRALRIQKQNTPQGVRVVGAKILDDG